MIPKEGQHVKCVFRNGMVIEGIVEKWLPTVTAVLKSLEDESTLIITKPTDDIMLVKIMPEKPLEEVSESPQPVPWEHEEKANYSADSLREEFRARLYEPQEKFKEAAEATDPHDIDGVKSLAQLKQDLIKTERQIIAEKLREHRPSAYAPSTTPYHYPSVISPNNSAYKPGKLHGKPGPDKKPRSK